jgi:hypothetical protein
MASPLAVVLKLLGSISVIASKSWSDSSLFQILGALGKGLGLILFTTDPIFLMAFWGCQLKDRGD